MRREGGEEGLHEGERECICGLGVSCMRGHGKLGLGVAHGGVKDYLLGCMGLIR